MDKATIERLVAQHTAARVILVRQKEDKKRGDMYIRIKLLPPLHHSHTITTSPTIHLFHQGNCTAKSCFSAKSKAFWICHTAEQSITNTECEVLKNVLHRNLIKILSSCCNINFEALVFEFMSNGSPEKWLCFHNYFLDILKRLNIMIDVGLALEYLQHSHSPTLCGSL
ncbi:hypothetical protein WN944_014148 [Citrus x changshan-huyou]|uniref:Serine-threonine/tyrosine-protein kinase catalytic domain-containing protein n=1 Tax=Citrus x changshan-huyou TaxID=2935761 RepID=A0AAP0M563_9ROSI